MIMNKFITKNTLDMSFNVKADRRNRFLKMESLKAIGKSNFDKIKHVIEEKYVEFKNWQIFQE
jgi:hypothetical protein